MVGDTDFEIARARALGDLPHGFFGHSAGKHQFGFGGMGDEKAIRLTRAAAAEAIVPGAKLTAPHQVHSPDVIVVEAAWDDHAIGRPEADALVTATPGLVLGIVTADCAPVLFVDREAGVVAAAHAGWRGAHGGVLENTIAAMESLSAKPARMIAVIGPAIAQASYEVDARFRANFDQSDERFFVSGCLDHWQFDLPGYIEQRLIDCGVGQIEDLSLDTYTLEKSYYSYRRATHRGEAAYGRQISIIGLGKA